MPTPITVSVNFIDLTGNTIQGYMQAAVVSPSGIYDLYVTGTGIIAPKVSTSSVGTTVSVQVWGNDIINDIADGLKDTYYTVTLFNTLNVPVWTADYLFTGAGPINLVGFPTLSVIPAPVGTVPTNILTGNNIFTGTNTFNGLVTFTGGVAGVTTAWSGLLAAISNLTIANAGFTTTFNQTSPVAWTWGNTTAATLATSQSSPIITLQSNFWNGGSAANGFTIQSVAVNGLNNGAKLQFSYFGGGGQSGGYTFDQPVTIGILNISSIQQSNNVFSNQVLVLASAGNAAGGKTTYTGAFAGVAIPQPGMTTTIAGFVNGGNNGTFVVFSCNNTTLVVWNAGGVSESAAATATTSTQPYTGGQVISILAPGTGSLNFQGTSYAVAAQIATGTTGIGLVLGIQGDPKDATFLTPYSNADKSHGVRLGAIYDGVGLNAGVLQWGQDTSANHLMNLLMPDGITGIAATGTLFTSSSVGVVALQASTGAGTNKLTISGSTGALFNCSLALSVATPTTSAGQLGLGTTTGFGNGAAGTAMTTTLLGTGSGPAAPQTVINYLQIDRAGTKFYIPLMQ